MNHEEFTNLSGIQTTLAFYEISIEPFYMTADYDSKEAFVEAWKKHNKTNIVKAHENDINRASNMLAQQDCYAADLERAKAENKRLQHDAETWETKFKAANSSWQEAQHMVEVWKKDCYKAQEQAEQVVSLKATITELENEITRLKARLFDMMEHETKQSA